MVEVIHGEIDKFLVTTKTLLACEYNEKAMSSLFCLKKTFAIWK